MSTNFQDESQTNTTQNEPSKAQVDTNTVMALNQLVSEMQKVDPESPEAKLNETSISDGKGGRIDLNEDLDKPENIKKQNRQSIKK